MLSDRPLELDSADKLGFEPYTDALADLIDSGATDTPLVISISAPWGAGKTTLAKMVQRRLREWPLQRGDRAHIVCWFNAWMHDDASHLGAALAAEVAREASRHRSIAWRLLRPLPSRLLAPRQRARRRLVLGLIAFVVAIMIARRLPGVLEPGRKLSDQVRGEFGAVTATIVVAMWLMYGTLKLWSSIGETVASFMADPEAEASRGSMKQVHQQLGRLIKQAAKGRRLVIFVDDLERCKPPRAVEVCEVASQLLSHHQVVTVLIGDMRAISRSADIKYRDLEMENDHDGASSYGRRYLEKIVQIQFDLPMSELGSMNRIITLAREDTDVANVQLEDRRTVLEKIAWRVHGLLNRTGDWAYIILLSAEAIFLAYATLEPGVLPSLFWWSLFAIAVLHGILGLIRSLLRSYTQRIQNAIWNEIVQTAVATDLSIADVESRVVTSKAARRAGPWLLRQYVRHYLAGNSSLRDEAVEEIGKWLPPLPRSAKRFYNRLHLVLSIALGRALLGGTPRLEARHLGKWVVLLEKWPALAEAVSLDREMIGRLESATTLEQLIKLLDNIVPSVETSQELLSFLTSEPVLSLVIESLVHLSPVVGRTANTPAALAVRVADSVRDGRGLGGGAAIVTRPARSQAEGVSSRPGRPGAGGPRAP